MEKGLGKQVDKGRLSEEDRDAILGRVTATHHIGDLADCDLVIESVVEDLEVKRALFAELDQVVKADAILATNTSTLPVVEMAVATERPDKVVGVHFFNPAPMMSLVEIIAPLTASDEAVATVTEFATACGKEPVQVADRAGFIVNALLFPYLNNAVRMLENGVASRDDIDAAMKGGCNFPMGPLALLDLVGPGHLGGHPRRPLRRVRRPQLQPGPGPPPHGRRRPPGPEVGPGLPRLPALRTSSGPRRTMRHRPTSRA